MKNKNNVTVTELVNLIVELQDKKDNIRYAHSCALGTIQAILDWEIRGYSKGVSTLQERINDAYNNVRTELDALKKNVHADQSDRA